MSSDTHLFWERTGCHGIRAPVGRTAPRGDGPEIKKKKNSERYVLRRKSEERKEGKKGVLERKSERREEKAKGERSEQEAGVCPVPMKQFVLPSAWASERVVHVWVSDQRQRDNSSFPVLRQANVWV